MCSFLSLSLLCSFLSQFSFKVSALLGRIPSAVGYQPTLATDMGTMQERITTTKKGSITSVQVISGQINKHLYGHRLYTYLLMI